MQVIIGKAKLDQYGINIDLVLAVLKNNNKDYAIGFIINRYFFDPDFYYGNKSKKEAGS